MRKEKNLLEFEEFDKNLYVKLGWAKMIRGKKEEIHQMSKRNRES